jgi:hypothetical protein
MSKKLMLLAAGALTVVAFAALPAVASAGEWKQDCPGGTATCTFTTSGGHAELRATEEPTITCTSSSGSGSVSSGGTTGTFGITFKGCTATLIFTFECHTSGAASGEIKVASSVSHNIYLKDDKTDPGILVTPATTSIVCGSFSQITVTGNGLVGDVTQACNSESSTLNINFEASPENAKTQRYEQNTKTGTLYDLHMVTAGSATTHTATMVASGTATFTGGGKGKITCL